MKFLKPVLSIGKSTFLEILQEKYFIIIITISIILTLFSLLLGYLSLAEQTKIIIDVNFGVAQFLSVILGGFLGSNVISKDISRQTILVTMARPISRDQYILGKMLGIAILLLVTQLLLGSITCILSNQWYRFLDLLLIVNSLFFESLIVTLFAILLGLFIRPSLSFFSSFTIMLLGHSLGDIEYFFNKIEINFLKNIYKILELIIPQFNLFNWKTFVVLDLGINLNQVVWLYFHSLTWGFLLVYLSILKFRRTDFV